MNTPSLAVSRFRAPARFLVAVLSLAACSVASAALLYEQPFTNDTGSEKSISVVPNWATYTAADGAATTSVRVQTQRGGAIYTASNSTGWVIRGTGLELDLASVGEISINTVQTGTQARFQFLVQIDGGAWYVSNTLFTPKTASSWDNADAGGINYRETLSFTTEASAWSTFAMTASGISSTALPGDLTGANITGVGIWTRGTTVARYDDLHVAASAIPEPSAAVLAAGAAALGAGALHRRRR